jgi:uncharacterized protein YndB with AHSA1/START domain
MEAQMTENAIEREIAIAARPETVWEFLVDPEKVTRWMGTEASFDARPGGVHRVKVVSGNTALGEFVELDPPRRLVFTFGWEGDGNMQPGSTTIDIELIPDGDGTVLRFAHRGLPDADAVARHSHGWDHYLQRLTTAASGGDPGADPWLSGQM